MRLTTFKEEAKVLLCLPDGREIGPVDAVVHGFQHDVSPNASFWYGTAELATDPDEFEVEAVASPHWLMKVQIREFYGEARAMACWTSGSNSTRADFVAMNFVGVTPPPLTSELPPVP